MRDYKIINTYSEEDYNGVISEYESIGCRIYVSGLGGTEAFLGRKCLAVIHKCFASK